MIGVIRDYIDIADIVLLSPELPSAAGDEEHIVMKLNNEALQRIICALCKSALYSRTGEAACTRLCSYRSFSLYAHVSSGNSTAKLMNNYRHLVSIFTIFFISSEKTNKFVQMHPKQLTKGSIN